MEESAHSGGITFFISKGEDRSKVRGKGGNRAIFGTDRDLGLIRVFFKIIALIFPLG